MQFDLKIFTMPLSNLQGVKLPASADFHGTDIDLGESVRIEEDRTDRL